MKFNKSILIIFMVLISIFAISAVSASDSDNIADTLEVSADDSEIELADVDENVNEVLSVDGNSSDVDMNIIVEDNPYDERVSINITVIDPNSTINYTESGVEIYVDGEYVVSKAPINPTTGQSGLALALGDCEVGTHYVQATLINGTEKILTKDAFFSVTKATPIVNVEDIIVNVYENVTVPINVADKNGNTLSGEAIVTIFWGSDSLSKRVSVVNGSASADFNFNGIIGIISSMSMGDMMGAMMGGDSGGMNWEEMFGGNGTFNWQDMLNGNGSTSWQDMFGGNGSGGNSWADMFGGNGSGGNSWADMFSGNGSGNPMAQMMSVTFDYIFTPGNYNITTTFLANRNYDSANTTSNLLITYLQDVVYLTDFALPKNLGNDTVVTINVIDKYTNPIANITVTSIVDDKDTYNVTLNDKGTAKLPIHNLVAGEHKLYLQSTVNGTSSNITIHFDVPLIKADVEITAKDITVTAVNTAIDGKIGKDFTATLKDELGNVLNNKTVQISINNEKHNVTTDADGVAKLQLNIAKAGTYTCTVAFLTDASYNGAFEIAKVTVNKQAAKLTVAKKTYKAKAKTKKVTATFKSAKGKSIKNKKITFKVKGKTYTAKTNAKGVATIKVKLNKKGTYKVTAKFAGDSTYKAISKTVK